MQWPEKRLLAPFVRTRVLNLTTHYAILERLDNTTSWVIKWLELTGGVCAVRMIRTYHHIIDISQVACSQRGKQDDRVCLCGETRNLSHHQQQILSMCPSLSRKSVSGFKSQLCYLMCLPLISWQNHLTSLSFIFLVRKMELIMPTPHSVAEWIKCGNM